MSWLMALLPPPVAAALMAVGKFLAAIPWQVYALILAIVLFWWHGESRYDAGYDKRDQQAQEEAAVARLKLAQERLEAAQKAYQREQKLLEGFDAAASRLILERAKGYEERDKIIADLRTGAIRLQKRFQCPPGVPSSPGPGGSDAGSPAGFTGADAEIALGIAADGDAAIRQLSACQAILKKEREP